jgi:transposase InsO family protein
LIEAVTELAPTAGTRAACSALGVPRATFYRRQQVSERSAPASRPRPPLALSEIERRSVLDVLHSERFVDAAPHQIYATLLDEKRYLCSVRTMYRILAAEDEVRERRNQCRRPAYTKPELLATGPNEVWSWDITKLKGPVKWSYFYLYVILDIFSRYVVGWMVARRESAILAQRLVSASVEKQGIVRGQLTLHADRGSSMTSKTLALLLADLGVTKTHSRPYTSTDNPYSEAHFKTFKYRPEFPDRFGSPEDARTHCHHFFPWYNHEHRHGGLALLTPADVHYGRAQERLAQRSRVLEVAFQAHPERFKGRPPLPGVLPEAVWINPPPKTTPEDASEPTVSTRPDAELPPQEVFSLSSGLLEPEDSTTVPELP